MKYMLVGDDSPLLYKEDEITGNSYRFSRISNDWVEASEDLFIARTGFDPSEPEGSPYRYGCGDQLKTITYISEEEAMEYIKKRNQTK